MKKMAFLIAITCVLLMVLSFSFREMHSMDNQINSLHGIQNYVVYYNMITPEALGRITAYDMAIINIDGVTRDVLNRLKASNTMVYSYVSLVSVEKTDALKNALMKEEDYLYVDGEKVYNPVYDCFQGNILSENYENILMQIIEERVIKPGFHGVFFDTLDEIEYLEDPALKQLQLDAYMTFYKKLKVRYPGLSIIQNRGFSLYIQGASNYLDGLIYEDLHYDKATHTPEDEYVYNHLTCIANRDDNVLMAISHENRQENYAFCLEHGWPYYYSSYSNNYLEFEGPIDSVIQKQQSRQ